MPTQDAVPETPNPANLARPEGHVRGVGGEDVQHPDAEGGDQHGPPDGAPGISGLLGQRCRALEPAERQHGEHRAREHPGQAVVLRRRVRGAEHRPGVVRARVHDQEHGQHHEHCDLERPEHRAQPGRRLHPVVTGGQHDQRAQDGPRPPQVGRVAVPLGVDRGRHGEAELEQHQRRDQRPDQHVPPSDQEPDGRVQAAGGVGRHRARGGQLTGQLADAGGRQQAGDQREQHGQRQRPARVGRPGRDRRGDRGPRGHVGDALEQHLPQPDRVPPQPGRLCHCTHTRLTHHRPPVSRQARLLSTIISRRTETSQILRNITDLTCSQARASPASWPPSGPRPGSAGPGAPTARPSAARAPRPPAARLPPRPASSGWP